MIHRQMILELFHQLTKLREIMREKCKYQRVTKSFFSLVLSESDFIQLNSQIGDRNDHHRSITAPIQIAHKN